MNVEQINTEFNSLKSCNAAFAQQLHDFAVKLHDAAQSGDAQLVALYNDLKSISQSYRAEQQQILVLLQTIHEGIQRHSHDPDHPHGNPSGGNYQNFAHSLHHSGFGQAIVRGIGFGIGDDLIRHIL
jgi:hypothetical protein